MVRIRVNPLREKRLLCIRVVDNGVGIQLEQLRQLRGALSQPGERWEHIGIYNVAARLRLLDRNSRLGYGPIRDVVRRCCCTCHWWRMRRSLRNDSSVDRG